MLNALTEVKKTTPPERNIIVPLSPVELKGASVKQQPNPESIINEDDDLKRHL
jgi:hypothetical protein